MSAFSWRGVLAGLGVLLVTVVCVRLGFWQLDRLDQRRQLNAALSAAAELPAVVVDRSTLDALERAPDAYLYRRATASGEYLHSNDLVLRGRSHEGRPGVHLVTPLRLDDGGVILVNRGWVPSPDGASIDPRSYAVMEPRRVTGLLQRIPDAPDEAAPLVLEVGDASVLTYRRLDRGTVSRTLGVELPPLYLQQLAEGDGVAGPVPVPPPSLEEGPHLGYAIQWFGFAGVALVGFSVVVWRNTRRAGSPRTTPRETRV